MTVSGGRITCRNVNRSNRAELGSAPIAAVGYKPAPVKSSTSIYAPSICSAKAADGKPSGNSISSMIWPDLACTTGMRCCPWHLQQCSANPSRMRWPRPTNDHEKAPQMRGFLLCQREGFQRVSPFRVGLRPRSLQTLPRLR